ncbi:MAG TPA: FAD-binding oxidoreductase [Streptosporangiaceae bacterium]
MAHTADIVIIGGGMAGVSVAANLLGAGGAARPGTACGSVLLLEAENELAYHTTGRSAAKYLESYGSAQVRALTRASRARYDAAAGDGETPPLLTPGPEMITADAAALPALDARLAEVPSLRRLTAGEARAICPVLAESYVAGAAIEDGAADIDVLGLHQHYLRAARRRGLEVLTGARVRSAVRNGNAWRIETSGGTVEAGTVVNAAGAWADEVAAVFGAAKVGLTPMRRTLAIVPAEGLDRSWPIVADMAETFYFRPEGDALLISPTDETPSDPVDAKPDELDVALAIERVNAATTLGIRSVRTAWAGLRTFAPDRLPVVGHDPAVPGLFWLAGQGGYGIQMAPALAACADALVRNAAVPADLLADGVDPAALTPSRFAA